MRPVAKVGPHAAGIVGACWYLTPERFQERCERFAVTVIGGVTKCSFVAMKGDAPSQLFKGGVEANWLSLDGKPFLDISAFAVGAASLPNDLPLYLILNDTLFERHAWRLISRRLAQVRDSLAAFPSAAAAGEVHPSTDLLMLDVQNLTRSHLSTFCLLLNNAGFQLFRELLSELPNSVDTDAVDSWIESQQAAYPALRPLLHVHLYGPTSPWSWKGGAVPDDEGILRRKAVTVIFEYLFTVRLLTQGVGIPINQGLAYRLKARLGRHG